jgi:hypothetical protein
MVVDDPSLWPHDPIVYPRAQPNQVQPVISSPVYWEHFNGIEWDPYALIPPVEDSCGEESLEFQMPMGMWTR